MTSSGEKQPTNSRRFFWLATGIVAAIAIYTAGWYYAAGLLTDNVTATIASLNRDGKRASCENTAVRGFPFRIGVFCRSVMFEDAGSGVGFRARQFRSAAQVYAPRHAIGEIDGPATLEVPGLTSLNLDWTSMRASARLTAPLPERLSAEAKDLKVSLNETGPVSPLLWQADVFELHLRPVNDDIDLAIRFGGLAIDPDWSGMVGLPALRGLVDVQLVDGTTMAVGAPGLRGRSGVVRNATVYLNDGPAGVSLAGPVFIDEAGLIDADFQLSLHEPDAVATLLSELFPEFRQEIGLARAAVISMGETPVLPLRIEKGNVSLGFFSLGFIPPV